MDYKYKKTTYGNRSKANKYCIHANCGIIASFNYKGESSRLYCTEHKMIGMENVRYRYCKYDSCKNISIQHEFYCEEHYCNINETAKILIKMMHSNEVIL